MSITLWTYLFCQFTHTVSLPSLYPWNWYSLCAARLEMSMWRYTNANNDAWKSANLSGEQVHSSAYPDETWVLDFNDIKPQSSVDDVLCCDLCHRSSLSQPCASCYSLSSVLPCLQQAPLPLLLVMLVKTPGMILIFQLIFAHQISPGGIKEKKPCEESWEPAPGKYVLAQ